MSDRWNSRRIERGSLALFAGAVLFGASCSLVNSFDSVVESTNSSSQPSGSNGGGGSPSSSSSSQGTGASTMSAMGGGGSSSASTGTGAGGSGGSGGSKPLGLIVVAGGLASAPTTRVLSALNPTNGNEFTGSRQTLNPVGVVYDGVTDLWYIFDADNFPPIPSHAMTLHVGTINPGTGAWHEVGNTSTLPILQSATTIAVLNNRLIYRAYDPTDSSVTGLAIIDTTVPATPVAAAFPPDSNGFFAAPTFLGFIATRGSGDGGFVNLITQEPCGGAPETCQIQRQKVTIPATATSSPLLGSATDAVAVPPAINMGAVSVAWTSQQKDSALDLFIYPPVSPDNHTTITHFNPSGSLSVGTDATYVVNGVSQFVSVAVAECAGVAVVSELAQQNLYAIPIGNGGSVATQTLDGHPPNVVVFEPVTSTVVSPLRAPFVLGAYSLGGSSLAPTLTKRQGANWAPPTDLNVDIAAVRELQPVTSAQCN